MKHTVLLLLLAASSLSSATFSVQGTFVSDDQIQLFNFSIASSATVSLISWGSGGGTNGGGTVIPVGGFDTYFGLYTGSGFQIATNGDSCAGPAKTNGACLDAFLSVALPAGNYMLSLTQTGNAAAGDLIDGFTQQGQGNYTANSGCNAFCDSLGVGSNGKWAVDIAGVTSASQPNAVPEPFSILLAGGGLLLLAIRKRLPLLLGMLPFVAFAQTVAVQQDATAVPFSAVNYGSSTLVNVGGSSAAVGLVQFDLSQLPFGTASANVSRATLQLFLNKITVPGALNISRANGSWTEAGVTGNNAPVAGAAVASGVASGSVANQYLYVDATNAVKGWLSGSPNNGFLVSPGDTSVNVGFDSKESATTSNPAELTIYLTTPGATGPQGIAGPSGPVGPAGVQGPSGPVGTTGPQGAVGQNGAIGSIGLQGIAGPSGPAGATGAQGPAGTAAGQIYTSNVLIPNTSSSGLVSWSLLGTGTATSLTNAGALAQAILIPVPCTFDSFSVTQTPSSGFDFFSVNLVRMILSGGTAPVGVGCSLQTSTSGDTCTSTQTYSALAGQLFLLTANQANSPNSGSRTIVSVRCR